MSAPYQQIVQSLRQAFPQPVSDRVHDAYFVFSVLRALDQVDRMKSASPLLGEPREPDYEAARRRRVEAAPSSLEQVSDELVEHLSGLFISGHPRAQTNVIPAPTIPSLIGGLLPSIYNPNLCSDESGRGVSLAEVEVTAMTADLVGYPVGDAGSSALGNGRESALGESGLRCGGLQSAGVFTFGGTGTLLYGAKIGLEKACPGTAQAGLRESAVIVCSEKAHYACLTVASWLGIGEQNVVQIPTSPENDMRTCLLESILRDLLKSGRKIACLVATMGTTDAFGLDDLAAIVEIRDRLRDEFSLDYTPHIHADAVIGWAWSVFNDYDFTANPLGFPPRTVRSLAGTSRRIKTLRQSDSLGIDFHKTGFTPYVSSLFLLRNSADLRLISRDQSSTPYLFQSGHFHPGKYTLETTRSGSGPMAALANLRLFGKDGLRSLLGHLVTQAVELATHLKAHSATTVLNEDNFGPVTLFRVYPDGVDTFKTPQLEATEARYRDQLLAHNAYNRRLFELIRDEALQGRGVVISLTDCYRLSDYGEPIVALKSYIMSPFSEPENVSAVLDSIWRAREIITRDSNEALPHPDRRN